VIEWQGVTEKLLAAEILEIQTVEKARTDGVI
jgi:hypothetical protein